MKRVYCFCLSPCSHCYGFSRFNLKDNNNIHTTFNLASSRTIFLSLAFFARIDLSSEFYHIVSILAWSSSVLSAWVLLLLRFSLKLIFTFQIRECWMAFKLWISLYFSQNLKRIFSGGDIHTPSSQNYWNAKCRNWNEMVLCAWNQNANALMFANKLGCFTYHKTKTFVVVLPLFAVYCFVVSNVWMRVCVGVLSVCVRAPSSLFRSLVHSFYLCSCLHRCSFCCCWFCWKKRDLFVLI